MTAVAYLRLRLLLAGRMFSRHPGRLVVAVACVGLVLLGLRVLQATVVGARKDIPTGGSMAAIDQAASLIGLALLGAAGLLMVLAPSSSRYPSHRADIVWLYTSPVSDRVIGLVELGALASRRIVLWLGSLALLEMGAVLIDTGQLSGRGAAIGIVVTSLPSPV